MHHIVPRFCNQCGAAQGAPSVPAGDDRLRDLCHACGHIQYWNPKIIVGALPIWGEQVLLCKRAIEPRLGKWTLPAGFMEENETLAQGATRETLEEANARIEVGALYTVISLPDISQVYMLFLAALVDLDFHAGSESLDVRLFREDEIPWDALAFKTIHATLTHYFAERRLGVAAGTSVFTQKVMTLRKPLSGA